MENPLRTHIPSGPVLVLAALLLASVGCEDESTAITWQEAEEHVQLGKTAWRKGNPERAEEHLNQALESAALQSDQFVDALLYRALARACLGKFDLAHKDLDLAARGAGQLDQVHAARAFVFAQQQDDQQAQAEWSAARRINPKIAPFTLERAGAPPDG